MELLTPSCLIILVFAFIIIVVLYNEFLFSVIIILFYPEKPNLTIKIMKEKLITL